MSLRKRLYHVYEFWGHQDGERVCLYVGMTNSLGRRFAEHRAIQPWWSQADTIRVTPCADFLSAEELEQDSIFLLRPVHNSMWNPDYDESLRDRPHFKALAALVAREAAA